MKKFFKALLNKTRQKLDLKLYQVWLGLSMKIPAQSQIKTLCFNLLKWLKRKTKNLVKES